MRKLLLLLIVIVFGLALPLTASADQSQEELVKQLLQEVQALKTRVADLENKLDSANQIARQASQDAEEARQLSAGSLKVSREIQAGNEEAKEAGGLLSDLGKRINIYGALELEGSYSNTKPKTGDSVSESNFSMATAEIFFEADINKYVKGLLHLLYEDEGDPMNVDEAFITVGGVDDIPAYFMGGKIYPAIALFETYMVSDPITQNIFETQATAAEVGWAQGWFSLGVGIYNSSVHETGDAPDNNINTYYARAQVTAPEGALGDDVELNFGLAYTNNVAAGNLGDEVTDQGLKDLVGGWSAMLGARYKMVGFTAEYIASVDDFNAGELSFSDGKKLRPKAYNFELAVMPIDAWTFAVRYEGSEDTASFEPDNQYGLTIAWGFLPDTTLSLEYLHGSYEDDTDRDLFTTQLAVGF